MAAPTLPSPASSAAAPAAGTFWDAGSAAGLACIPGAIRGGDSCLGTAIGHGDREVVFFGSVRESEGCPTAQW